ncbi:substrate-binding domain-containing protein [Streptomyces sp. NPDC004134]|uniref:substrate-binding domain-containing protein n=1 Tax=Streptomyces sp. NPDC004134 TaxID=3364691 RepID=UPI0036A73A70
MPDSGALPHGDTQRREGQETADRQAHDERERKVRPRCQHSPGRQAADEKGEEQGRQQIEPGTAPPAREAFASTGADRAEGFAERYREAGLPLPASRIVHSAFDTAGGRGAAHHLLSTPEDRPTALFAVNDFAAIGAAGAARDLGLRLGRDVALAGFNDTPLVAELPVPLTSVHSPMAEQGRRALNLLLRRIAGEEVRSEILTPRLMARESTGGPVGTPLR